MSSIISEIEELKILYKDIIDGCSFDEENGLYVKHLTDLENSEVFRKKRFFFERYKKKGLPTEDEKLQQLRVSEQWDDSKDEEILSLEYQISDNEKNIKSLIPQQQGQIQKIIDDLKTRLGKLQSAKREIIGRTANDFAERDAFNYFVYLSLYKDRACKDFCFKRFEDFEDLSDEETIKYIQIVEQKLGFLSEKHLNKIAVLPFFLNSFSYAKDNIQAFLNRPIVDLTGYQTLLLSLGTRNMNILSQSSGSPPALLSDTKIEDVMLWFDQNYSTILSKRNSESN